MLIYGFGGFNFRFDYSIQTFLLNPKILTGFPLNGSIRFCDFIPSFRAAF